MYRFPTPRDPRVGAWGAPNTPKSLPPPRKKKKKLCMRFRTPGTFLKKKFSRGKKPFFCVLRPQEGVFGKKKNSVTKNFHLLCGDTSYDGIPPMTGHLLWGDTSYVGTPALMRGHLLCGDISPGQRLKCTLLAERQIIPISYTTQCPSLEIPKPGNIQAWKYPSLVIPKPGNTQAWKYPSLVIPKPGNTQAW